MVHKKRAAAFIVALACGLSATAAMPLGGLAAPAEKQIGRQGEQVRPEEDDTVVLEQTVAPVYEDGRQVENYFDVTARVSTTEKVTEVPGSPDASVVLVLDVSDSMTKADGNSTRIENLRQNAARFVEDFASDLSEGAKREVAVVTFGTAALTMANFTDVADEGGRQHILDVLNRYIKVDTTADAIFSCSELDRLETGVPAHKHGASVGRGAWYYKRYSKPCTYKPCDDPNGGIHAHEDFHYHLTADADLDTAEMDKVGLIPFPGVNRGAATNMAGGLLLARNLIKGNQSGTDQGNHYVVFMTDGMPTASLFKENWDFGSTVFIDAEHKKGTTVGTNENYFKAYVEAIKHQKTALKKLGATIYSVSYDTAATNIPHYGTVGELLTEISDIYFDASNADQLGEAFESMNQYIRLYAKAWKAELPIGGLMEFDSLERNGRGGNILSEKDGVISWDLKGYLPEEDGNSYHYTLRYRVRLRTEHEDYAAQTHYPVGGPGTTLSYFLAKDIQQSPQAGQEILKTADFNIPEVYGYAADFDFKKIDPDGNPVVYAAFSLTAEDGGGFERTASSGAGGAVGFRSIPSGRGYLLRETRPPKGYSPDSREYRLQVSFGDVLVTRDGHSAGEPDELMDSGTWTNNPIGYIRLHVPETLRFKTTYVPEKIVEIDRDTGYVDWRIQVENTSVWDNWLVTARLVDTIRTADGDSSLNSDALNLMPAGGKAPALSLVPGRPQIVLDLESSEQNPDNGSFFDSRWGKDLDSGFYLQVDPSRSENLRKDEYQAVILWTLEFRPT